MKETLLEMNQIVKDFGSTRVLRGIDLSLGKGEIFSIVGENGAGKSTLMNILFGMPGISNTGGYQGTIRWEGQEVHMKSPTQAIEMGIGMVHQEFMLIPGYTVTENVKLNREILKETPISRVLGSKMSRLDLPRMKEETRKALDRIHMDSIREEKRIGEMPVGFRQFIEIAREIDKKNIRLIVFDEPTAVLTNVESRWLLDIIKEIAEEGISSIFISHKLEEVVEISDHILVMRDGEMVTTLNRGEADEIELARLMVGRKVDFSESSGRPQEEILKREVVLELQDLQVNMPGETAKGVSIDIHKGEIIGFCGLANQGKLAIANGIAGIYPAEGKVLYKGKPLPFLNAEEILNQGIAFVSEDRRGIGLLLDESISLNICCLAMRVRDRFLRRFGFFTQVDDKEIRTESARMIEELLIKCESPEQKVGALSGGNQQKVCLARAVLFGPEVLMVSEPTRGIDIGAKKVILEYLKTLNREQDMTIIITSSELSELRSLCDRVAVIYDGKVKAILKPQDSDEKYGMLMSGLDYPEGKERAADPVADGKAVTV